MLDDAERICTFMTKSKMSGCYVLLEFEEILGNTAKSDRIRRAAGVLQPGY
jgi:hypothetical protein